MKEFDPREKYFNGVFISKSLGGWGWDGKSIKQLEEEAVRLDETFKRNIVPGYGRKEYVNEMRADDMATNIDAILGSGAGTA